MLKRINKIRFAIYSYKNSQRILEVLGKCIRNDLDAVDEATKLAIDLRDQLYPGPRKRIVR